MSGAVVYRAYDRNGALLYIGSTRDFQTRHNIHMADHASAISFPMQQCAVRWTTEDHPTYEAAKAAEVAAIKAEAPYLNRQHNTSRWRRVNGQWVSLLPLYEMAWRESA